MIAVLISSLALLASQPEVLPQPPIGQVLPEKWQRRPSRAEIALGYPRRALRLGTNGAAIIHCTTLRNGALNDCSIAYESRSDFGFGSALLALKEKYQLDHSFAARLSSDTRVIVYQEFHWPGYDKNDVFTDDSGYYYKFNKHGKKVKVPTPPQLTGSTAVVPREQPN